MLGPHYGNIQSLASICSSVVNALVIIQVDDHDQEKIFLILPFLYMKKMSLGLQSTDQ